MQSVDTADHPLRPSMRESSILDLLFPTTEYECDIQSSPSFQEFYTVRFKQFYDSSGTSRMVENFVSPYVRNVGVHDLSELNRLFSQCYSSVPSLSASLARSEYVSCLENGRGCIFGAFDEGKMLSVCSVYPVDRITWAGINSAMIGFLFTDKSFRRLGCGRMVLLASTRAAWIAGAERITVPIGRHDESTRALCRSLGFSDTNFGYAKNCPSTMDLHLHTPAISHTRRMFSLS
ncbi:GNAT family N-acetyltransferase [Aquibium sp. ELW1220]|uniref:GNAT family N-acetyltransferase n=1 Tax=Aquibium sp. ELW1220 TaxID=2976766 RepID=UPI00339D5520